MKGRKLKFDSKQVQRMRDMKSEGLRNHEIARMLGVATTTVTAYLSGRRGMK